MLKSLNLDQRDAQEVNAMDTEEDKQLPLVERDAKLGNLNLLINMLTHLPKNQMLVFLVTIAEIQMVPNLFGATLLQDPRDGNTATQLAGNQLTSLEKRDALEANAMDTEEDKPRLDLERLVKNGMLNLLIDIAILLKRNQTLDSMETTAETQTVNQPFGATPQTNPRDGNSVTQLVINMSTRARTKKLDSGIQETSISFQASQ
jgi:hypothetical protein